MEYDYYPYDDEKENNKKRFTIGKLVKYLIIAFIVLVYALIFFRIAISNDTDIAKSFIWTEASVKAYNDSNGKGLTVLSQELETYPLTDKDGNVIEMVTFKELSDDGLFKVSNFMYVKETKEVIITLRYNDTCEELYSEKYGIDTSVSELFVFTLTGGANRYTEYSYVTDARFTYHYRRLIFTGIELDDMATLSLQAYCVGEPNYEKPVCDMPIYDNHIEMKRVDLSDYTPVKVNTDIKTPPYIDFE
ncbi:MAG: hypothetical protein IKB23_01500 [Clostridia bacterium]|nr:hypothetical protein [Clostridia bacterium]MBR3715086.1 hypothetical protein [Clostridia bacterium]